MKLGDMSGGNNACPSLGRAIAIVMDQPTDDQWLFDIVSDDGFLDHIRMRQIARTEDYLFWADASLKPQADCNERGSSKLYRSL